MENEEHRSGEDRRAQEWSHNDIMQAVIENSTRIAAVEQNMSAVEKKIDEISVPEDWHETLRDVAAVGRTGRVITKVIKWGTPIVAAVVAFWHYMSGHSHPGA